MTRLHLRAAFAWGVVASLLSALAWMQLVDPGLTGGVPWLGAGRLRFASGLAMLLGWNINLAAAVLYALVPAAICYTWFFGYGLLVNFVLAAFAALLTDHSGDVVIAVREIGLEYGRCARRTQVRRELGDITLCEFTLR